MQKFQCVSGPLDAEPNVGVIAIAPVNEVAVPPVVTPAVGNAVELYPAPELTTVIAVPFAIAFDPVQATLPVAVPPVTLNVTV